MQRAVRGAAMLVAGALLALVLGCGLYGAAVATRAVAAPAFNVEIGLFRLVSFTTNTESCARRLLCPTDHIRTRARSFYAIWLIRRPDPGRTSNGRPLLVLRQRDQPRR